MSDFRDPFKRVRFWMYENGAELLAENLAPGADEAALDACEKRMGFPLGADLRALWAVHDGQHEEGNGFYESYDLLSSKQADPEDVRTFLPFLREDASNSGVQQSGLTAAELASDSWIRIVGRDADGVAVNAESGRVFDICHDDFPALKYGAPSLLAWLTAYADRVEADDYTVAEGFGDFYLEERDRQAEAREAAREAEQKRRSEMPSLELLELAIEKSNDGIALQAFEKTEGAERLAFLEALFECAPAAFATATLRPKLNELTLSQSQWFIIGEGAKVLGNNALVALADKKIKG